MTEKMTATRHNGRSGSYGAYNPKHNDRSFDPEHSDHINTDMLSKNVYWDIINGYRDGSDSNIEGEILSFEEVERLYYEEHYSDYINAQNERNEKCGHSERNRTVDALRTNKKTCPEESIQQIGNIDGTIDPDLFREISEDFMFRFNSLYGEHVHIIDWALHLDETTPHIHERHVFDAPNEYGEIKPFQDGALELLGFEFPNPDAPRSRTNNRKVSFDAEVRDMFLCVCEEHGVVVDRDPRYAGRKYLEKNDYIIDRQKDLILMQSDRLIENREFLVNQNEMISKKEDTLKTLEIKISDVESFIDKAVDIAYERACDVVTTNVVNMTHDEIDNEIQDSINLYKTSSNSEQNRNIIQKVLEGLQRFIASHMNKILNSVRERLHTKEVSEPIKSQIKEEARLSLDEQLARAQKEIDTYNALHSNPRKRDKSLNKGAEL